MLPGVSRIIRRIIVFVRWLLGSEKLVAQEVPADARTESAGQTGRRKRFVAWMLSGDELLGEIPGALPGRPSRGFFQLLLSREKLPSLALEQGCLPRSQSLVRWILAGEKLPSSGQVKDLPCDRPGFARWLLTSEVCPTEETVPRESRTILGLLISPEQCPTVESGRSPRDGFLRRLLSSEACPQAGPPARERREGFLRWLLSGERL